MSEIEKVSAVICGIPLPHDEKAQQLTPPALKAFQNYCKVYQQKFLKVPKLLHFDKKSNMLKMDSLPQSVSVKRLRELTRMMK